jgi:hypothetical protein
MVCGVFKKWEKEKKRVQVGRVGVVVINRSKDGR